MSYNYKQCAESHVDSQRYEFYTGERICEEFQDQFQRILNGDIYNKTGCLNDFPPDAYAKNDEEVVSSEIQQNSSAKQAYTQPSSHDHFFPQPSKSIESEQPSQEQAAETTKPKKKRRSTKDGHVLSQNLGSKARSLVCKLMSRNKAKSFKNTIKELYTMFLKETGFANSQVVLLFSYLFLMKNHVPHIIYSEFRHDFLEYLYAKKTQARQRTDEEIEDGLIVKINANIQLVDYLFSLRGPWDFGQVQTIAELLYTGRQKKAKTLPLEKASQIYAEIIPSISKTSNTSTGCQVEL